MSKARGTLKSVAIALAGGAAITGLLYAIEHVNLTNRHPVEVDLDVLSRADQRKPLLARFPEQDFACGPEKTDLGRTICYAEIESFNGIPARYLAFFFDQDNHLTAMKLAGYASRYPELVGYFDARFQRAGDGSERPFLVWLAGDGLLTTTAQAPEGQEATVLWVNAPEVVERFQ